MHAPGDIILLLQIGYGPNDVDFKKSVADLLLQHCWS